MELIEDILRSKIFKFTTKVEVNIVNEAISYVDKIAKCFRLLCAFTILFYGLAPFINVAFIGGKLELPLPGWIPYNTDSKFLYFITFTFQMASISISAYNNSTIDILNFKLITLATSKLEILVIYLKNIDYEQMGNNATIELKKCVTFYSEILRFGTAIEDMFSNGILVQYLASIIVICLAGFQVLTVDVVSMEFTIFFTYFMAMVMQVALYCWYGHNLMVQSEELTNACYMSSWYVSDLKTRKILFIFMERAKKPIVLTAGKFFNLSLATLIAILRSSYSYFTVLRRLYQDK